MGETEAGYAAALTAVQEAQAALKTAEGEQSKKEQALSDKERELEEAKQKGLSANGKNR